MLDFKRAILAAQKSVKEVVDGAKNVKLEEALISSDKLLYEVTLSYETNGGENINDLFGARTNPNIKTLASLMSKRREHKVFLIDSNDFSFRGFRNKEF